MKRTLSILSLFLLASATFADVLIERLTETSRLTGQGIERSVKVQGYIIRNLDGTNGAAIGTFTINGRKFYEVNRDFTRVFSTTVQGANGKEYRVVTDSTTESNDVQVVKVRGLLLKGLNTTIRVSDSREIVHPRVLRGSSHLVEFNGGIYRVTESALTRIFSQTETREANARANTVDEVLARIVQRLEAAGYSTAP
jgi:hypothetical protein